MPLALAGDPSARFFVGVMYAEGEGVTQNDAEAARWYRLAADQGFAEAQYALGVMHAYGRGVPQDDAEAVRWFRPAANHDIAEAQFNLGVAYLNGWGVPEDEVLAYMWFRVAVARCQGDEVRERAVAKRDEVAAQLSPAERARGQDLARNWQPRVAARSEGGAPAYGHTERGERPRTQRQAEPNPFRAEIERRARRDRKVQQLLAELGYGPGPVDGVIGPRTRGAVRAFQADVGLPVDGEISDELYAALTDAGRAARALRLGPLQFNIASTAPAQALP